jgi:hypothetical protein
MYCILLVITHDQYRLKIDVGRRLTNLWHACPKWRVERFLGTRDSLLSQFLNFFCSTSVSILWRTRICIHISDCVETVYKLPLLPNETASEIFLHKSGAVRSVDWIFIIGAPAWGWLGEYVALEKTFYDFIFKQELLAAPVTYISILYFALFRYFYLFFKVPVLYRIPRPNIYNSAPRGQEDWVQLRPWKRHSTLKLVYVSQKVWIAPQTKLWSLPFLVFTLTVLWPSFT